MPAKKEVCVIASKQVKYVTFAARRVQERHPNRPQRGHLHLHYQLVTSRSHEGSGLLLLHQRGRVDRTRKRNTIKTETETRRRETVK